jgi:hypothetical protein
VTADRTRTPGPDELSGLLSVNYAEGGTVLETLRAVKFLFMAPLILLFLLVVNLMTSPGQWWVQWAALGLGIAWFISLLKVIRAVIIAGGLAALGAVLLNRTRR